MPNLSVTVEHTKVYVLCTRTSSGVTQWIEERSQGGQVTTLLELVPPPSSCGVGRHLPFPPSPSPLPLATIPLTFWVAPFFPPLSFLFSQDPAAQAVTAGSSGGDPASLLTSVPPVFRPLGPAVTLPPTGPVPLPSPLVC